MKLLNLKPTIVAIAILLCTSHSFAQKFYVNLYGGYNFVGAAETKINSTTTGTVTVYEKTPYSLGKGTSFGGTLGYMFNKFLGAELDVSYLIGATSSMDRLGVSSFRYSWSSTFIRFVPTIVITPGFEKINPYAKLGLILGTGKYTAKESASNPTDNINATLLYNGGLAIGFSNSFGASYYINKHFSIYGELNIISLSYGATRAELIERTKNGVDQLPNMSTRAKITEYSDSHTDDYSSTVDENVPRKGVLENAPFSSVGFNLGVKYIFYKKTPKPSL